MPTCTTHGQKTCVAQCASAFQADRSGALVCPAYCSPAARAFAEKGGAFFITFQRYDLR